MEALLDWQLFVGQFGRRETGFVLKENGLNLPLKLFA
jgi:hypothetical protein